VAEAVAADFSLGFTPASLALHASARHRRDEDHQQTVRVQERPGQPA